MELTSIKGYSPRWLSHNFLNHREGQRSRKCSRLKEVTRAWLQDAAWPRPFGPRGPHSRRNAKEGRRMQQSSLCFPCKRFKMFENVLNVFENVLKWKVKQKKQQNEAIWHLNDGNKPLSNLSRRCASERETPNYEHRGLGRLKVPDTKGY